jgi:hypothetical protein
MVQIEGRTGDNGFILGINADSVQAAENPCHFASMRAHSQ